MHPLLVKRLVEKGAIRQYTEFEAYYHAHGLSCVSNARLLGRFRITAAKLSKLTSEVVFEAEHSGDRAAYRFTNAQIVTLDGMLPDRLAAIYHLSLSGDDLVVGKRRGRKPRLRPVAAIA
jgi:hypothetical protein